MKKLILTLLVGALTLGACMDNSLHVAENDLIKMVVISEEDWVLKIESAHAIITVSGKEGVNEFKIYAKDITAFTPTTDMIISYLEQGYGFTYSLHANKRFCITCVETQ